MKVQMVRMLGPTPLGVSEMINFEKTGQKLVQHANGIFIAYARILRDGVAVNDGEELALLYKIPQTVCSLSKFQLAR
jgi:hypothetical protein